MVEGHGGEDVLEEEKAAAEIFALSPYPAAARPHSPHYYVVTK